MKVYASLVACFTLEAAVSQKSQALKLKTGPGWAEHCKANAFTLQKNHNSFCFVRVNKCKYYISLIAIAFIIINPLLNE